MTVQELRNNTNYTYHHTGSCRGYESRKTDGHVKEYNGRYGKGFIAVTPRFDTTQYVNIEYYIEK